jgi:hypothetical protein
MSYSEEEEFEDAPDFVAEFAARERVGDSRPTFIDINIDVEKGRKGRLSLKAELSSEQLFLYDLQKIYYKYIDDISIGAYDIETIKGIVQRINHIGCKNAIAFLFAYSTLDIKEQKINSERLSQIKGLIKNMEGIELEDIIRYARLIMNIL